MWGTVASGLEGPQVGVRQGLEVEVSQGEVLVPLGKPILLLGRAGLMNTHLCSGNLFSPEGL